VKKTTVKIVRVRDAEGRTSTIPSEDILNIRTSKSIMSFAGTFEITVDNEKGKNSKLVKEGDEIEITLGYKETGISKVMGGYVDRIILEKNQESKVTMQLEGRDYASVLLDTKISGKIEYKNGYSQVLREILRSTPLSPSGILDTKGMGTIVLRNAALIDVVRQIAEEINWTFEVDVEKVFHFRPFAPPKRSGITLTDKDIRSFRFIKRRK